MVDDRHQHMALSLRVIDKTGQRCHVAQRAGLHARQPGRRAGLQALAHRAVDPHHRQAHQQFGRPAAGVRGLQYLGQLARRDALAARQARAVVQYQAGGVDGVAGQPAPHFAFGQHRGVGAGLGGHAGQTQLQVEQPGQRRVRRLDHAAQHLAQRRRNMARQQPHAGWRGRRAAGPGHARHQGVGAGQGRYQWGVRGAGHCDHRHHRGRGRRVDRRDQRRLGLAHAAGPAAAQAVPQAAQLALGQQVAVDQLQPGPHLAAGWKAALQPQPQRAGHGLVGRWRGRPVGGPVAAGAVGQAQRAGVDLHVGQRRHETGGHPARVGRILAAQRQRDQAAAQVQRVGDHVVPGLRRLVERRGTQIWPGGPEQVSIEHDVAGDLADALAVAQLGQQGPQLRQAQFGVGTAAQHQIAGQHVALLRRAGQQFGEAADVGPQPVQRHGNGEQLEGRARLHRPVGLGLPVQARALCPPIGPPTGPPTGPAAARPGHRHHHRGQRVGGQAGLPQRVGHRGRQRGIGGPHARRAQQQQQQGAGGHRAPPGRGWVHQAGVGHRHAGDAAIKVAGRPPARRSGDA